MPLAKPTTNTAAPAGVSAAAAEADETATESALVVAQSLWGLGNLSPLDHLFGSTALINVSAKANLGFIGYHLGRSLQRYSEDTKLWIDSFETDPALTKQNKKKKATIQIGAWHEIPALFKKDRYPAIIVLQASDVCTSLEIAYAQCTHGLKATGRAFIADLMLSEGPQLPALTGMNGKPLRSIDDHKKALAAAGLKIEKEIDLCNGLVSDIRGGFRDALLRIPDFLSLDQPRKNQRSGSVKLHSGISGFSV